MNNITNIQKRTWAEINTSNLIHNFNIIKSKINQNTKVCCVIKANAYGHGSIELAKLYTRLGADFLAVSNIKEALDLRTNNITLPILILGFTPPECADILNKFDISQCVYSLQYAKDLNSYAEQNNVKIKIHIKIDTGMGRLGFVFRPEEKTDLNDVLAACKLNGFITEGIFTHFAIADGDANRRAYTQLQYDRFAEVLDYLDMHGIKFDIRHCANSATIFNYNNYQLDMVRAGIILYGLAPSSQMENIKDLRPAMTLKTVVSHIKELSVGETIGYGRAFESPRTTRIATLPIGYADGIFRSSTGYSVLINGSSAPIVGKICMDQTMIDISDMDCRIGDVVTIFGDTQGHTASDLALHNGTINYETTCNIGERVPRIYTN